MGTKDRIFLTLMLLATAIMMHGMEYGLRFKSHSFPATDRTYLKLGDSNFAFDEELAFGFEIGFYDKDRFGLICTLTGDDGTVISLVSSAVDGGYQPGVVINDKLNLVPMEFNGTPDNPQHPILILRKKENKVIFTDNHKERHIFDADLSRMKSAKIEFGRLPTHATVAPVEIQDIRIFIEAQNTHKWELRRHEGDSVYDDLNRALAVAESPHWILDDHIDWTKVYSLQTDETIQTAFDPEKELFYIVAPNRITEFNPISKASNHINVAKDGRAMKYSNYLVFDTISDRLLSYSFEPKQTNMFDFATHQWVKDLESDIEPRFANHGFTTDGKNAYMFGGYGFYMYNNTLVKLDLETGAMEDVTLHPLPDPRTSSSLCAVDGKLYIFGGMGNTVGKQEIPANHYFDLWEYDIETMKGRKLWETDTVSYNFLPSSSMYYTPKDSCFYVASTLFGGCMMRISPKRPGYEIVSGKIHSKMDFRDCVFNLYRSANGKNYYLVIDKRQNDFSHDYAIYHIAYPFRDVLLYDSFMPSGRKGNGVSIWWWVAAGALILLGGIAAYFIVRKRRKPQEKSVPSPLPAETAVQSRQEIKEQTPEPTEQTPELTEQTPEPTEETPQLTEPAAPTAMEEAVPSQTVVRFDRTKSSVSLLGTFSVMDKEGSDITTKFTSRMKDLIILLILQGEKDPKGVSYETLDEVIWGDKDEKSAKNNRNVYMRKLRLLLEEVGDIEISFDKGYYRIEPGSVTIDYHEIMTRLKDTEKNKVIDDMKLEEILELLLHGPLLPDTSYDWLDSYKSNYTSSSIQILSNELERITDDNALKSKIADSILLHDPLSEEAMTAKCHILTKNRMKGVAKNIYDSFCREYEKSYGEKYPVPFSEIIA